jgi:hypothetical protein
MLSLQVQFPSVFEPASKYLSLVMPAYNEQDRIRSTLDETFRCSQLFEFEASQGERIRAAIKPLSVVYRS